MYKVLLMSTSMALATAPAAWANSHTGGQMMDDGKMMMENGQMMMERGQQSGYQKMMKQGQTMTCDGK